jgi:hypothetical protein
LPIWLREKLLRGVANPSILKDDFTEEEEAQVGKDN